MEVDEYIVKDKTNEIIEITDSEFDNMRLMNLKDCQVRILCSMKTVYLNEISNCNITIFPVQNSIFGDHITESEINCVAQQIRIHHTSETSFKIFVASSMIIEDRSDILSIFNVIHQVLFFNFCNSTEDLF